MHEVIYIEINVLCICMLCFILFRMRKRLDRQPSNVIFMGLCVTVVAILSVDCLEEAFSSSAPSAVAVAYVVYLALSAFAGYLFFVFVEAKLGIRRRSPRQMALLDIPLAVAVALVLVSIQTGWALPAGSSGAQQNVLFHVAYGLLIAFYPVFAIGEAFSRLIRSGSRQRRLEVTTLLACTLAPVIGVVMRFFLPNLPLQWPIASISLFIVFVNYQEYSISTDSLTGLNNRRQFDRHVDSYVENASGEERLFMLMIDVDRFKQINDTYGHLTGDDALRETALLLKKSVAGNDVFLARLGGDEFAILGLFPDRAAAERLRDRITMKFRVQNFIMGRPYRIELSIGIGEFGHGHAETVGGLVAEADKDMYETKSMRHDAVTTNPGGDAS